MVKIRAFISKKAVPRGIDIDNKEYWQPYAITIKKKNGGGGDDGDGGDDEPTVQKCTITVATIPENATIVATDEDGNVYRTKTFQVTKGKSVTIIATPDASSTGYVPTTKVLTSQDTNQDSYNYTLVLDSDQPVEETTTINIVSNVAGVLTYVYTSNGLLLNPNGENTIQGVLVESVITVKPSKDGYKLRTTSAGTIVVEDGNDIITGITVEKNMLIQLSFDSVSDEAPVIKGIENDYSAFYEAQEFVRSFKATFYKIRIYGDLAVKLITSWGQSSQDSAGGESLTDTDQSHHGEQDISFKLELTENNTGLQRRYNFTIIAENKSGQQVSKSFTLVQQAENVQKYNVGIITKINGVVTGSSDIIRKVDGENIVANQTIEVPANSEVTFYVKYLGKEYSESYIINSDYNCEFNFEVVNISLGTVTDENGEPFNTWKLTLFVRELQLTINDWKTQLVPVIKGTEYLVTGNDTSGQRPDYNSGAQIADGYQLNVVFGRVRTYNVVVKPVDENGNDIVNAAITLKVGVVGYNNGSSFPSGTKVGYNIEAEGYEIATLSDGSPSAIVAGVTPNPVVVTLITKTEYVNVTIRSTLNGELATGARIYIDQQYVGTGSPFVVENLVNGRSYNYTVELDGQVTKGAGFTASPNLTIDVEWGQVTTKYSLQVSMLNPSDAKIEINDYTDGSYYVAYGEIFKQIDANHRITIVCSKPGYVAKNIPPTAVDYPAGDPRGTLLMDNNKAYIDLELGELPPPPTDCTYALNVSPSDAIVEFAGTDGGHYQEYPNNTFNTHVGSIVYWRVRKTGYVTQTGNSGVLSGNKTDNVTLVQETPGVNNNVLFVIRSIKDKDTNEDLTGVTVKLQLKGVNQPDNKIITQSDLNEVSDNPPAEWSDEIGKFGGVAEKGTDVKVLITKQGYEDYNRWNSNNISISPNYANNILYLDVIMQTPKCMFTLYPIKNLNQEDITPDLVYIREGNGWFTEDDRVNSVGNRYRKEINRGANVYYLVIKNGYSGGYGFVNDVQYSQSKSVTLIGTVIPETVEVILTGNFRYRGAIVDPMLYQGRMTIYDAPVPTAYSLTSYALCTSTYVGENNEYVYKFVVPKNELIVFATTYNNRSVQCIGSFSKNTSILMNFETEPTFTLNGDLVHSPNLHAYHMVDGEISYNTDNEFALILTDLAGINVPDYRGDSQDHAKLYYINEEVEGLHVKGTFTSNPSPLNNNIEIDIPFGDMLTLYLNFVFPYIKLTIDGEVINAENQNKDVYFDYRGETKQINIESNDSWTIE